LIFMPPDGGNPCFDLGPWFDLAMGLDLDGLF
jgi:hypothetical protein